MGLLNRMKQATGCYYRYQEMICCECGRIMGYTKDIPLISSLSQKPSTLSVCMECAEGEALPLRNINKTNLETIRGGSHAV
jgi:hypothetical protein